MMKKLFVAAVAAAALAAPVSAATFVGNINLNIGNCAVTCSGTFGTAAGNPSFDDFFTVNFPNQGAVASQIGEVTVNGNVTFTSVFLQAASGGTTYDFTIIPATSTSSSQAVLRPTGPLAAGQYNLFVRGTNNVTGNAYAGTLTLAAVPEPATWAMFILGFGAIGLGLRRRNATVHATKARLTFA